MSIPFVDDSGNIRRQVSDIVFANSVGRVWNEPGKTKRWQIREALIFTQDNTRQNKINLVRQDKMLDSTLEIG